MNWLCDNTSDGDARLNMCICSRIRWCMMCDNNEWVRSMGMWWDGEMRDREWQWGWQAKWRQVWLWGGGWNERLCGFVNLSLVGERKRTATLHLIDYYCDKLALWRRERKNITTKCSVTFVCLFVCLCWLWVGGWVRCAIKLANFSKASTVTVRKV